jgi:hypothetical protein
MDTIWIVVISVIGLLTAVAVLFWAVTDFLDALGRYIQLYRDVGHLRHDLIKFAYEVGKLRYAKFEHASLETLAETEREKERNDVGGSVSSSRHGDGAHESDSGEFPSPPETGGSEGCV